MITSAIQRIVRSTDAAVARVSLALRQERNALLSFLFHSLFRDEREIALNAVDPLERTTVAQFRQIIEYYLEHGYRFVSPNDLRGGLNPDKKYAMLTFDDGYFNNSLALPVLEEFGVPALFFISTGHVLQNKCFWWDVLYRSRIDQGASARQVYRESLAMKSRKTCRIEELLKEQFGPKALAPRGDVDRPFTPAELREFARSPLVHLGNHTADHAILTNYPLDEAREQVRAAQESLREITGVKPISIAYPNGAHSPAIIQMCAAQGLSMGFTIRPEKSVLPLDTASPEMFTIGRFVPHAGDPIARQCRTYRSDYLMYGRFRDLYLRVARGS